MLIKGANTPKVLFIKGVFKKDCLSDDIFDKKILENSNIDESYNTIPEIIQSVDFVNYEKLPNIFEGMDSWPKTTSLLCWNCHQSFNTIPVFIPGVIEPLTKNIKSDKVNKTNTAEAPKYSISVNGVFSSFGCAFSYVKTQNYSIADRTEIINKLKFLHKLFYNNKIKEVSYYPSPYQMIQYGGDMSISEYKMEMEKYKKENA